MFVEFDKETTVRWNNMSYAERQKAILNEDVYVAVNIQVAVERRGRIFEEHKYYQVYECGNVELADGIRVIKITDKEVVFKIKNTNVINISIGEEKTIENNDNFYSCNYRISISDIKYGQIVEL